MRAHENKNFWKEKKTIKPVKKVAHKIGGIFLNHWSDGEILLRIVKELKRN